MGDFAQKGHRRMKKTEILELIELALPDPLWLESVPGSGKSRFGIHRGNLQPDGSGNFNLSTQCNGILELVTPSVLEEAKVICRKCFFRQIIARGENRDNWRETIWEWIRMAFAAGLEEITWKDQSAREQFRHTLSSVSIVQFLPDKVQVDKSVKTWVIPERAAQHRIGGYFGISAFLHYRIAISKMEKLGTFQGALRLAILASLLMSEMESGFQEDIRRAAGLAAASSQKFHPRTRRYS